MYRATSAIVAALGSGVERIIPVATLDEARKYRDKGYITAAERQGAIVDGFDLGNSPLSFTNGQYRGKTVVLSTSNGTKALLKATAAKEIVVGAFLNLTAVTDYLAEYHDSVMFLCAGWRDRFNLEDTIAAGAMAQLLLERGWNTDCDSCLAAMRLYDMAKGDIEGFMKQASHTNRLQHLQLHQDIIYCNSLDLFDVVPIFNVKGEICRRQTHGIHASQ